MQGAGPVSFNQEAVSNIGHIKCVDFKFWFGNLGFSLWQSRAIVSHTGAEKCLNEMYFWKVNQMVATYDGLGRGDPRLEAIMIILVDRGVGSRCLERKEPEGISKLELIKFRFLI